MDGALVNSPGAGVLGEYWWEIIGFARERGLDANTDNLKYWHEEGAIQRPIPVQHPSGPGRTGLYPPGTGAQVVALKTLLNKGRTVEEASWRLWLDGFPVKEELGRGRFVAAAAWFDTTGRSILDQAFVSDGQELSDAVLDPLEAGGRSYDRRFRLFRKLVGAPRLGTLFYWIGGVVRGQEIPLLKGEISTSESEDLTYDHSVIVRGFGLQRIHRDKALTIKPIPLVEFFLALNRIARKIKDLSLQI